VVKHHGDKFGEDMNWYFDQVLYGSNICDYKLAVIRNEKITPPRGIIDMNGKKELIKESGKEDEVYNSKVILHRLGEVIMPVEVLIHFDNGEEILETWDGKSRSYDFSYERPEKIVWAQIDPENKIMIDVNLLNNSLTVKPQKATIWKYTLKFLFWLENLMQFFSVIV